MPDGVDERADRLPCLQPAGELSREKRWHVPKGPVIEVDHGYVR